MNSHITNETSGSIMASKNMRNIKSPLFVEIMKGSGYMMGGGYYTRGGKMMTVVFMRET